MEIEDEYQINDGHYHELMDRLHVITSVIEDHITTHPLTHTLPEVEELINQAQNKLIEAYQIVGSLS